MSNEDIYSTVPAEAMQTTDIDRHKITEVLKEHPGQFFKSKKLAALTGYPIRGSCVELRKAITELIEVDGVPICGNARGFGYATHPNMIFFYIQSLEQRKQGLQRRIDALYKIHTRLQE